MRHATRFPQEDFLGTIRLTYQNTTCRRVDRVTGRPDPEEIEVTPEMISAGEDALRMGLIGAELSPDFSAPELAASVYRAMESVRGREATTRST